MNNELFSRNLRQLRLEKKLTRELDRRGLTIERNFPAELAESCRKRMG